MKTKTTISVDPKATRRLWKLRRLRNVVPEKKPGRGRPCSDMETIGEVINRAIDALEREAETV